MCFPLLLKLIFKLSLQCTLLAWIWALDYMPCGHTGPTWCKREWKVQPLTKFTLNIHFWEVYICLQRLGNTHSSCARGSYWLLCLLSKQMPYFIDFTKQTAAVWVPQTKTSSSAFYRNCNHSEHLYALRYMILERNFQKHIHWSSPIQWAVDHKLLERK